MTGVVSFPTWKRNATPVERLEEVLQLAKENPDRFDRVIIGWMTEGEDKGFQVNYAIANLTTAEMLGLLRLIEWKLQEVVQ